MRGLARPLDPSLLKGVCIYQDLILKGEVVVRGRRDCDERWELMAPHLPRCGAVLDVGSNLGWFGLRLCEAFPQVVVASVEADRRSAALQRAVLAAADHRRIALLTGRAGIRLARVFARRGQRFAAVLCLSVLHWLPHHREFLTILGSISDRLLVEHPDPREPGVGHEHLRWEIGEIGSYLQRVFPGRRVTCLGATAGYRSPSHPRSLWLVGPPRSAGAQGSAELYDDGLEDGGLDVRSLLACGLSWPPRSWWHAQVRGLRGGQCGPSMRAGLWLTYRGLEGSISGLEGLLVCARLGGIPEKAAFPWQVSLRHWLQAVRGTARSVFWPRERSRAAP